jgi:hypothetical protein
MPIELQFKNSDTFDVISGETIIDKLSGVNFIPELLVYKRNTNEIISTYIASNIPEITNIENYCVSGQLSGNYIVSRI